jgi:RNA polymerase-binding transcription factor DksA
MTVCVSHADLPYFERKLRDRMEQLRKEIRDARAREQDEQFTRIAGEARDAVDASVANLTVDTTNAEILRDEDELREIDEALGRVAAGSYGICLRCGQPIERARLEAYPAARRHAHCQEAHDAEIKLGRTPSR